MSDVVERAHRWKAFYEEDKGLRDFLRATKHAYFERMEGLNPSKDEEMKRLAIAVGVVNQMDAYIQQILASGENDKLRAEHVKKVEDWKADKPAFLHRFNPF